MHLIRKKSKFALLFIIISFALIVAVAHGEMMDFRERWAILIGVGKYKDQNIPPLKSPENDVQTMKKILTEWGEFKEENVFSLTNETATYDAIIGKLSDLMNKVQQDDLIIFYFSGRGTRIKNTLFFDPEPDDLDECLLPYDADTKSKGNFLRDDDIGRYLYALNAKRTVIIIDSSYSGGDGKGISSDDAKGISTSSLNGITQDDYLPINTVIIESCRPDETVADGVFTPLLREACEGNADIDNDGNITIEEAFNYVRDKMRSENRGTPQLKEREYAEGLVLVKLLEIISEPSDAEIILDGKSQNKQTPSRITLSTGHHEIEIRKKGYKIEKKPVDFSKPKQISYDFKLIPITIKGTIEDIGKLAKSDYNVSIPNTNYRASSDENGKFAFTYSKNEPLEDLNTIIINDEPYKLSQNFKVEYNDIDIGEISLRKNLWVWWLTSAVVAISILTFTGFHFLPTQIEYRRNKRYPIWKKQIYEALSQSGQTRLNFISWWHRKYTYQRYIDEHSTDYDFGDSNDRMYIKLQNAENISTFNSNLNIAKKNLDYNTPTPSFIKCIEEITHILCKTLIFKCRQEKFEQFGIALAYPVDAPPLLRGIPSSFPFIYLHKRLPSDDEFKSLPSIMEALSASHRFAIIIVLDNVTKVQEKVEEFTSSRSYDFIVLGEKNIRDILMAKEPQTVFIKAILEQVDLTVVSPYITKGAVPEYIFFGREQEIKTIMQTLPKRSIGLVGGRMIGKTSILKKIQGKLHTLDNYDNLYMDCHSVFDYSVFRSMVAVDWKFELGDDVPSSFYKVISQRYEEKKKIIIILMDEIDAILKYDTQNDEKLFKVFRTLSQGNKCIFIFSGERILHRQSHDANSPLFNFCDTITLKYLEEKAAQALITEPMKSIGVRLIGEEKLVDEILRWSSCHPRMVQYVCSRLIEVISKEGIREINLEHLNAVRNTREFRDEFIETFWGKSTSFERLITLVVLDKKSFSLHDVQSGLTAVEIEIPLAQTENALENLQLSSILKRENGNYSFMAEVFPIIMKENEGGNVTRLIETLKAKFFNGNRVSLRNSVS
ncbi:PEGA domain-containing protein [Candidatus Poribacteria bacterium]|nr:PEGA domain-containing protein [Candidatus Poribacteria bacterium]